jgi:drug/metabolite transporter (DMT)-like permease
MAFRYAPAPTVAPFTYISLITYSAAGYVTFGHVPDAWTLAGAAIIIASGLYIAWRERVRAREPSNV